MNTITIDGKEYPVRYGMRAIGKVLKMVGGKSLKDLSKVEDLPIDKVPDFVMAGLENASKIKGESELPSMASVIEALDQDFRLYTTAMEIFGNDISPDTEVKAEGN